MNRVADRLLAVLLLAIGVVCFATQRLAQSDASIAASFASPRLVAFFVAGALCVIGAQLFFAGLLPGRPSRQAGVPLFGRTAELQNPGRPRLRQVFLVLPVITVLALLADQFGPWPAHRAGSAGEVAAPSEPKANEPKDVASAPPEPPTPPDAPPVVAPAPPPQAAPPPTQADKPPAPPQPAPLPAQPPAAPAIPAQPPEVALAPSPPEAAPPQTVAPLPPAPPARP